MHYYVYLNILPPAHCVISALAIPFRFAPLHVNCSNALCAVTGYSVPTSWAHTPYQDANIQSLMSPAAISLTILPISDRFLLFNCSNLFAGTLGIVP